MRMAEDGYFNSQRVEFIDGEVIDLPPQKNSHAYVISMATANLLKHFDPSHYWIRTQATLQVAGSMPEPDIAVLKGAPRAGNTYATASGGLLVIEVADTTVDADLGIRANLYAAGSIADYWVINIPDRKFVVHRQPIADTTTRFGWRYADIQTVTPGQRLSPLAMATASIDPADWLP